MSKELADDIRNGYHDNFLKEISEAIEERREAKRQKLLEQVRDLYGDGYTIAPAVKSPHLSSIPSSSRFPIGEEDAPPTPDPLADPETGTEQLPLVPPEGPDHRGMESRSPVIGPFNPD